MKDEERRLTAYHEAGHASRARQDAGNDPLHKVTIVPRGRALGPPPSLPEDDRHDHSKHARGQPRDVVRWPRGRELVFGEDKVTTGAGSDIQQATGIARRNVTQWGLSDASARCSSATTSRSSSSAARFGSAARFRERTAQLVDAEVKRLLDEAYDAGADDPHGQSRSARPHRRRAARARDARPRGSRQPRKTCRSRRDRCRRADSAAGADQSHSEAGRRPGPRADSWRAPGGTRGRVNVTPLALHSPKAVRDALSAGGWEAGQAANAALGAHQLAFRLTDLDQDALEALVHFAGGLGLEVFTGDRWAILAGSRSKAQCVCAAIAGARAAGRSRHEGRQRPCRRSLPGTWDTARGPVSLDQPDHCRHSQCHPGQLQRRRAFSRTRRRAGTRGRHSDRSGGGILDVGGESTRPGRQEQVPRRPRSCARVVPVVEAIVRRAPGRAGLGGYRQGGGGPGGARRRCGHRE